MTGFNLSKYIFGYWLWGGSGGGAIFRLVLFIGVMESVKSVEGAQKNLYIRCTLGTYTSIAALNYSFPDNAWWMKNGC